MAGETTSTNMGMPIPGVSITSGPTWAEDVVACLTILDAHTHVLGNGVPITPSGLNINADLSFQTNSALSLYKAGFTSQSSALSGSNFLSFIGGNLYVNDGSGNQIPITSGGGVAGSPGSIGGLASPAAATYTSGSKLFSWTADSNKAAAMDNGSVTIRETNIASAKGITLQSPSSLAADYALTLLPALPASTQFLSITSSGIMGTSTPDAIAALMTSTGANAIASSMTATGANAIAASMTATGADAVGASMTSTGANAVAASRTRASGTSVGIGGVAIATQNAVQSSSTGTYADVTGLSLTIVTSGRPVYVGLAAGSDGSNFSSLNSSPLSSDNTQMGLKILKNGSLVNNSLTKVGLAVSVPCASYSIIDTPVAGTYTYKIQFARVSGSGSVQVSYANLIAYEL